VRRWLAGSLLTVVWLAVMVVAATAEFSVSPLNLILEISAGQRETKLLSVTNTGRETLEATVSLFDWFRSPDGSLQILPAGSLAESCANWIVFSPSSMILEPGERAGVQMELSVPEDVTADHWSMLMIEEQPVLTESAEPAGMGASVQIVVAYAVKILQQDPSTHLQSAQINDVSVLSEFPLAFSITYENTGTAHLQTEGTLEIRDIEGETVRQFSLERFPTLPGEVRHLEIQDDEEGEPLPDGSYYVIVVIDFGGDVLIQGGRPFEIPLP